MNVYSNDIVSVFKGSSASKSSTTQLQTTADSLSERSPGTGERKEHDPDEGITDASIPEVDSSEGVVNEDGQIEAGEMKTEEEKIINYENPHSNVFTLEEVKRHMEEKNISPEVFRPEVVENELQRLLAFFDRKFGVLGNYTCIIVNN